MHKNNYKFNKKTSLLIHVPKSGGTTFSHLVTKYKLDNPSIQHPIIANGLHRPISKYCEPIDYNYIIIIRNPVERVISYYNMVKRNAPNYPHAKFIKNIPYFFNNCWEVNNQMTLYLAGINYTSSTIVNKEIYEKAKTNLKEIKHIIFFENYNENISHFFLKNYDLVLSNSDIPNIRKHNYSKELNYKDKELIIEKNKYDILLYEYAKEITLSIK